MSAWMWPTTADVGMRVFAPSFEQLLIDAGYGMQQYLLSEKGAMMTNQLPRHYGEWVLSFDSQTDRAIMLTTFLEEILYNAEVQNQWFLDGKISVTFETDAVVIHCVVTWVEARYIEREIEIKAVTRHQLCVEEVPSNAVISSQWETVPTFEGPGWYADVIFDI